MSRESCPSRRARPSRIDTRAWWFSVEFHRRFQPRPSPYARSPSLDARRVHLALHDVQLALRHLELGVQHLQRVQHDRLRRQRPRALHREQERVLLCANVHQPGLANVLGPLDALAVVRVRLGHVDLDLPSLIVVPEHRRRGGLHELYLLLLRERRHEVLVDCDLRFEPVHRGGDGLPLGVVPSDPFTRHASHVDLLILSQLEDEDGVFVAVRLGPVRGVARRGGVAEGSLARAVVHGLDGVVLRVVAVDHEIVGGDVLCLVAHALDPELDGDVRHGLVVARVVVRELHVGSLVRDERDESEAVRDEFVAEARRVLDHLDEVDGDGWHLRDDHAAERVGDRGVRAGEDELDRVFGHLLHHDVGPPLPGIPVRLRHPVKLTPLIRAPGSPPF
mmetsp:Transcript_9294/g.37619  ORF Transcript_9294/g.37619 Transcript_9294/m.37619 type:complete len:391 (-) Transcript_9294:97-1269(-)